MTSDLLRRACAPPSGLAPGVYFRVLLGGVTGHLRFAEDCGLLLAPEECVPLAGAMLRVFAAHGDRTDRKKGTSDVICWIGSGTEKFLELGASKGQF